MWGGGHSAERKGKENGEYNQNTLYKLHKEPTEMKSLGSCTHVRINVSSSFIYHPSKPKTTRKSLTDKEQAVGGTLYSGVQHSGGPLTAQLDHKSIC